MSKKFSKQFRSILELAVQLYQLSDADALLILLDGPVDPTRLKKYTGDDTLLLASAEEEDLREAQEADVETVLLEGDTAVIERVTQALLKGIADEILAPGAEVVAVYSGFEPDTTDSISYIRLDEHLGRLTSRDLRALETSVPLDTLKTVVDVAVDIGREGREGQSVGTMFVVGDCRKVLTMCHPGGFDPVRGYNRTDRDIGDPRVREAIKEVAQMDGAFIVAPDGIVERSCQILDAPHANLTLSKGLGARHWAAAAISKNTNAIAVVVSETAGTVRIFQNGEVLLRVEPFRRAMKWKDFDYEPPEERG